MRIGILGAARIAPAALIKPAQVVSGVEVVRGEDTNLTPPSDSVVTMTMIHRTTSAGLESRGTVDVVDQALSPNALELASTLEHGAQPARTTSLSAVSSRSTTTSWPSRISPASRARASWSPIADWTSRRSGRAPYSGS
ncbi:MAG: hypothetical protein QOE54_7392 [Streptosporangiaceae bacterium]|jgi:hypothetical protein|nr:hypothetical protein [Streptosporangiaceae bacterium]MDX6435026.1 hypothetical protein [Streptosporangiaceae bacterium]